MTFAAGTRLGVYEITSLLGVGGMGEVYRAHDPRLGRDVAIKILAGHLAENPDLLARFEREARAVAALSHPAIRGIHDIQSDRGIVFTVMELLEGETLRVRLDAGPLAETKAIAYALEVAQGMEAAHAKQIVHRDLKPENLFVTKDGHAKILDFGLARAAALSARGLAGEAGEETVEVPGESLASTPSRLTVPGTVLGTPEYMSPEQVKGEPADQRSDVFSLGAVLCEMASGRRSFRKRSAAETMAAILGEEPAGLGALSPSLRRFVRRCVQKRPEDRVQSMRDVASELRALGGARPARRSASVRSGGRRPGSAERQRGVPRIAVLPFENVGAAEDEYFADGITDEVRGKLTALSALEVIARGSSTPYKKTTKTPAQIAAELEAGFLLSGTVRWEKGEGSSRVLVSPELVEIRKDDPPAARWQQSFDADLARVFEVQSDIATQVARALGVTFAAGEMRRLSEEPTRDLAAYDAFLRGEEAARSLLDPASLRRAIDQYEKAVALDPRFALSWARLARANSLLHFARPAPACAERAREAAERAHALAPLLPEGHTAMGAYHTLVLRDYARAVQDHAQAHRLAPGDAEVLASLSGVEQALGRWEQALRHARSAVELDPRSGKAARRLGYMLLWLRRHAAAREAFDRGLAVAPADMTLAQGRAMVSLARGDLKEARSVLARVPRDVDPTTRVASLARYWDLVWVLDDEQVDLLLRLTPTAFDDDVGIWGLCLAQAHALRGDLEATRTYAAKAADALVERQRLDPHGASPHSLLGLALAYLGRKDEAIREGQRAVDLLPISKDAAVGPYHQHQLARIYMLSGEAGKALNQLERLLKVPYYLSTAWIEVDPNFATMRADPRFERMLEDPEAQ